MKTILLNILLVISFNSLAVIKAPNIINDSRCINALPYIKEYEDMSKDCNLKYQEYNNKIVENIDNYKQTNNKIEKDINIYFYISVIIILIGLISIFFVLIKNSKYKNIKKKSY
jgi:hypothetical protein